MTILKIVQSRTLDDAGCMVWQHGCANGHPAMRYDGRSQLVRRLLWQELHGEIPQGNIIHMTCGTPKCVNPECMELTTFRKLCKELGSLGMMSGLVRSAAIARSKRVPGIAKITMDIARDIRASDATGVALSKRYGIHQAKVSAIRSHKSWREYEGNPFMGLMR